jgi:hypothetical protein
MTYPFFFLKSNEIVKNNFAVNHSLTVTDIKNNKKNSKSVSSVISWYRQTAIFRHPFFGKQWFSLKYVLAAPLKIFGGMYKLGIYVILKSSLQF